MIIINVSMCKSDYLFFHSVFSVSISLDILTLTLDIAEWTLD